MHQLYCQNHLQCNHMHQVWYDDKATSCINMEYHQKISYYTNALRTGNVVLCPSARCQGLYPGMRTGSTRIVVLVHLGGVYYMATVWRIVRQLV